MKKILFAASECEPFIKTGGLADVVGSLPKYIDRSEYDVRVILPKYSCIAEQYRSRMEYITNFYVNLGWRNQYVGLFRLTLDGICFYFVDNEFYFTGNTIYGDDRGDIEKFAFFSKAVLAALPILEFRPDIIHCHDWQTGLIPVFLKHSFAEFDYYSGIRTIMTIHNLRFQGVWNIDLIKDITGLPDEYFTSERLEAYGNSNYLKGGIVFADRVTTVSASYADEIKTEYYGEGLDGLMRARENVLSGIVNGIDYEEYDPAADSFLPEMYDTENFRTAKLKCKRLLQKELGLARDDKKFMIGIVSRLTDQKGLDLVKCVIEEIADEDTQFVVLGTGEPRYEDMFRACAAKHPDRVSANICFSNDRSHKIYAGCDAFLMPSQFEPCGLSQLMSLRYGTVPIVRETGGLKDTVVPYNEYKNTGTGFSFANYNAHEMLNCIRYAKELFLTNKRRWNLLVKRAMKADFSWNASAKKYEALYNELIAERDASVPVRKDKYYS